MIAANASAIPDDVSAALARCDELVIDAGLSSERVPMCGRPC